MSGDGKQDAAAGKPAGDGSDGTDGGDGGPSLGLVAGGAAVAVLGAAAVWQTRRRGRD